MTTMNLKVDKMRYQTNSLGYWLVFLSLALSIIALFTLITYDEFVSVGTPVRVAPDLRIGLEIALAIVLMLTTFLAAEKVKYYHPFWSGAGLFGLAALNFLRIFNIPLYAFDNSWIPERIKILTIIEFALAGALLIAAGFISLRKVLLLKHHMKAIDNNGNDAV
ncbi:MAG: hypothetical protein WC251_02535 [Candidatus Izemoplasmatales bacterium]|jgi:general stress protein CsbA|nr:hypothetical protein [Candidatus Izemoplasmatales bacterium]